MRINISIFRSGCQVNGHALERQELLLADGGTTTVMEQGPTPGVVLSEVDKDCRVWVPVNPQ